jgi:PAS domain S-box-containing protein
MASWLRRLLRLMSLDGLGKEHNDLKRAYEELMQERELLRGLIDTMPDPVYVTDTEGRNILSNIADAAQVGDRTPDQIVGTMVRDLFPAEEAELYLAEDRTVVETGRPAVDREESFVDETSGTVTWYSTSKYPLRDNQGEIVGVVALAQDITRRKEAEREVQNLIAEIRDAANALSTSAAEILAAAMQQTSGASEQSAAITQTTTTVDELNSIAEQSVARSAEMAEAAQRTVDVSHAGQAMVQETIAGMDQIKARVEGIAENILALSEQTQQIGEIIATVKDIATQSNMLALNASVEAARAGEQGKGFAVVAMEVRSLAEQSRDATAQVSSILSDIQNATNAAVMATEEGTKGVEEGVILVRKMENVIQQLASVIARSAESAAQILAGGQQQRSGIEQIALSMANVNQVTAQSLVSARQMEKAARDLNALARSLTEKVAQE